jgi:hypothetical protein
MGGAVSGGRQLTGVLAQADDMRQSVMQQQQLSLLQEQVSVSVYVHACIWSMTKLNCDGVAWHHGCAA